MSINRRTATAVRSIGVVSAAAALALGVGGTAFACSIGDFSANVTCDSKSGQALITIHDTDSTRPVTITVLDQGKTVFGPQDFTDQGDFTVSVPWKADETYDVHAAVANRFSDSPVTKGDLSTAGKTCAAPTTQAPPPPPVTKPATPPATTPATAPATTPAASPSSTTSAPAVADTNAPSPAAGGAQDLAETGGGSNTGMIAGIAAALVAVGGGAVFALRRRTATARH